MHGAERLRKRYGTVPAVQGPPLPTLEAHAHRHPGLCLLAQCATVAQSPLLYALARGAGRAAKLRRDAEQLTTDDEGWRRCCTAIRSLSEAALPGWIPPAQGDLPILCSFLRDQLDHTPEAVRPALVDVVAFLERAITPVAKESPENDQPEAQPQSHAPPINTTPPIPETREEASSVMQGDSPPASPNEHLARALPSPPIEAIRNAAQRLHVASPDVVHPIELRACVRQLSQDQDPITTAVTGACLLAGQPALALDAWHVAATKDDIEPSAASTWLVLDPPALHIPNLINRSLPPAPAGSDAVAATMIPLPLHADQWGFQSLLELAIGRVGGRLIQTDELAHADLHLRRLRERLGITATRKRLCQVLPSAIRVAADDELVVAYLSGRPIDSRLAPQLHYRLVPVWWLRARFLSGATQVQDMLGNAMEETLFDLNDIRNEQVGSLLCPHVDKVRAWTAALVQPIASPMRGKPTLARLGAWHNAFTVYVLQLLQFAIGSRATNRGILACWPDGQGCIQVADKNGNDIRNLPLCNVALQQWREYATHRMWIVDKFGLQAAPKWFLLEIHQGKAYPAGITPKSLHELSGSPFAENAGRHALASALGVSIRWPGHRIAQWLGQATLGNEPGAPYACHAPVFDVAELRAIDGHLASCGFKVVRGLGHG